ncbi:Outer membrane lipoprotein Blc [Diplonema papillatum]|nr:Outer membrane lipoprotein Blc [Diplonema papillatum]
MMSARFVALSCLLAAVQGAYCTNPSKPAAGQCEAASAVTGFNTTEYFGKWYQVGVSKQFFEEFERNFPICVTAEYSLNAGGYVNVVNKGYNSTGGMNEATGKATQADPTVAALEVTFGGPVAAPYNVIKVLYDAEGRYSAALVWSCSLGGLTQALWILSRDKILPETTFVQLARFACDTGIDADQLGLMRTVQNCTNA